MPASQGASQPLSQNPSQNIEGFSTEVQRGSLMGDGLEQAMNEARQPLDDGDPSYPWQSLKADSDESATTLMRRGSRAGFSSIAQPSRAAAQPIQKRSASELQRRLEALQAEYESHIAISERRQKEHVVEYATVKDERDAFAEQVERLTAVQQEKDATIQELQRRLAESEQALSTLKQGVTAAVTASSPQKAVLFSSLTQPTRRKSNLQLDLHDSVLGSSSSASSSSKVSSSSSSIGRSHHSAKPKTRAQLKRQLSGDSSEALGDPVDLTPFDESSSEVIRSEVINVKRGRTLPLTAAEPSRASASPSSESSPPFPSLEVANANQRTKNMTRNVKRTGSRTPKSW